VTALELAVRDACGAEAILDRQEAAIENEDLAARFRFVRGAVSADADARDAFFAGLASAENRRHEPWVLEALSFLHHPIRIETATNYIAPSLELLEEIRTTGDIFFPRNWITTILRYHTSDEAVEIVTTFLAQRDDLPTRLRLITLQAADHVIRANRIRRMTEIGTGR
jgi:aminopeptidase N